MKAIIFVALTFAISWLFVGLYLAVGGSWTMPGAMIVSVVYMFVPMVSAVVVQRVLYKARLKEPLRIHFRLNRWFIVAWLLPATISLATIGVSLLIPGLSFTTGIDAILERLEHALTPEQIEKMRQQAESLPVHPFWLSLAQGLIAGATINAVAGFGEELGWRGLLQRELQFLGFWRSSAMVGTIWGVWHAPLIVQGHNYPQHPWAGVFMMIAFTVLLSPLMTHVTIKANSVIAAAIFHGTLNATVGLPLIVVQGGSDLTVGVTGLAGFITLALANLGLFLFRRDVAKTSELATFRR